VQALTPAVSRVTDPLDRAQRGQLVGEQDHQAGRDAQIGREFLLRFGAAHSQRAEQDDVPRPEAESGEPVRIPRLLAHTENAEANGERPHRRTRQFDHAGYVTARQ
jgi:hypothetical protein